MATSIIYAFFLFLVASYSVQPAVGYEGTLSLGTPVQSNDGLSRRADARNISVRYHDSINRLGLDSYCGIPGNLTHIPQSNYAVEDCRTLMNTLAGNPSAGYYSGWWDVKDWDYCRAGAGDYSWMMIAGWETCNFAVVMPDCPEIATP